jgi:hypothetical protein
MAFIYIDFCFCFICKNTMRTILIYNWFFICDGISFRVSQ